MDTAYDLLAQEAAERNQARELEAKAIQEVELANQWSERFDVAFMKLADVQKEQDWHLHRADDMRGYAAAHQKRADKLRKKASRLARRKRR